MGFLDKAKETATKLTAQAKDKVDEVQNQHKADALLEDLGRITYRQRGVGHTRDTDAAKIDEIVTALAALGAEGAHVTDDESPTTAHTDDAPPPPPAAEDAVPPPPPA
ncbi:MAG: hypothetical protein WCI22_10350 [Actinomycetota bacterium]